ncbi:MULTISPECIES: hypothetical protein [Yersinia pseudotuberculosis complex]|uniref:hypothetical protein n=1 Tax=Yersinia pseudotuberculosis complex TaxID=1649845 RepID=UPI0005B3CD12|nr:MULTISPECIES: hypothetical protein [Yersinia pseudotuberculosis complex]
MSFSLDAKVDDLFVNSESIANGFKVNRPKAREIALEIQKYINDAETSGGNKHASELDASDAVVELLTKIKLSDKSSMMEEFNSVLLEEKIALSMLECDKQQAAFDEKIKNIEEEAKQSAINTATVSWIIAAAAVFIFAAFLFA